MFNYKTWKLYYPGVNPNRPDDPFPVPVLDPGVDENGNSITPDSLKKNMTIPAEAPGNDLAKMLANMLGADPANKVEAASELIKYLDPISKLAIPDYSEAETGATLKVVDTYGPPTILLDADIVPDEFIKISPGKGLVYDLETPISLVQGKEYFLEINSEESFSAICDVDEEGAPFVTFGAKLGPVSYTFWTNSMGVSNESGDVISFSKPHFTLSTPSVIKKLQWGR